MTSSHHIAAEMAVRRIRMFLARIRRLKSRIDIIKHKKQKKLGKMTVVKFVRNESNMYTEQTSSQQDNESRYGEGPQSFMSDRNFGGKQSGIRILGSGIGISNIR